MPDFTSLSLPQLNRLAQAFACGSHLPDGSTAAVLMSGRAPLYRIAGVYANESELRQLQPDTNTLLRQGWTKDEISALQVVTDVPVPQAPWRNELVFVDHTDWTEPTCCQLIDGPPFRKSGDRPLLAEITSVKVTVETTRGTWTVTLPRHADTLFLTRGSTERILYPYYAAVFGRDVAEAYRNALLAAAGDSLTR